MFRFLFITPNLSSLQISSSLRSLSVTPHSSPTLHFLINSCGLSQESALTAAKCINLKVANTKPDSVLELFRNYGFTQTHITNIITRHPTLLLADPNKTLKPKLEFLSNNGISGPTLEHVISTDPTILRRSLEKQIVPCIGFLKTFFGNNSNVGALFSIKRGSWVLHKFSDTMGPNVDTLRSHGVPDSSISKMIMLRPRSLSRNCNEFSEIVREIVEMGFDPLSLMFIHGVCAVSGMKKHKWESKLAVFKSFGWSDGEIRSLFVKQPKFMNSSQERIRKALDFFVNKMGWTVDEIAKYPTVLFLAFENRIVPRCFVVQLLISKGLVKRKSLGSAMMVTEDGFLNKYVMKYQDDIPMLLEMYRNKMGYL